MEGAPAVSPDGSKVVFYGEARGDSSEVAATDLYVMGKEGGAARFVAHCYRDAAPGK
jgi:Tol biopolymer transport system component